MVSFETEGNGVDKFLKRVVAKIEVILKRQAGLITCLTVKLCRINSMEI